MIPYGRQTIEDDDVASVAAVLRTDWLTQGPEVERFEQEVAAKVEVSHAVAFSNGTIALHAAAHAAAVGAGDRFVTSALTFVASANAGRYVGATVDLMDIDGATLNGDLSTAGSPDCLVPVHFAGLPMDLRTIGTGRPRVIIEDAAHALGAHTPEGPIGNCARSDMCMFSFHPVKAITTGEGGIITTNSGDLADGLRRFRNHGITRGASERVWFYEVTELGTNGRMTDIHAALGRSQLVKLERFISRRNELAARYRDMLSHLPIELPPAAPPGFRHAYHLFAVRVPDRDRVFDALVARGVRPQVHYVPVYRHPAYADLGGPSRFPSTEAAYAGLLSLPLFPSLTDEEQDHVVQALEASLS